MCVLLLSTVNIQTPENNHSPSWWLPESAGDLLRRMGAGLFAELFWGVGDDLLPVAFAGLPFITRHSKGTDSNCGYVLAYGNHERSMGSLVLCLQRAVEGMNDKGKSALSIFSPEEKGDFLGEGQEENQLYSSKKRSWDCVCQGQASSVAGPISIPVSHQRFSALPLALVLTMRAQWKWSALTEGRIRPKNQLICSNPSMKTKQ